MEPTAPPNEPPERAGPVLTGLPLDAEECEEIDEWPFVGMVWLAVAP